MRPNPIIQDPNIENYNSNIEDSVWKDSFSENPTWVDYGNQNPIWNTYYTDYITDTTDTVPKDECCLQRLNTRWCFLLAFFSFLISGAIFYVIFFCNNC